MSKPKRTNVGMVGAAFSNMFGLSDAEAAFREIDIAAIRPNPKQPRRIFRPDSLRELAQTIADDGVQQPILVREAVGEEGVFELVAGERRWRASQIAGRATVPAIVKGITDEDLPRIALLENVQRDDLNAVELAFALRNLLAEPGMTQERAGEVIGKGKVYVSRALKICDLPPSIIQEYEAEGEEGAALRARVTMAQLMEIAGAKTADAQTAAWEAAKAGVGSKALRDMVAGHVDEAPPEPEAPAKPPRNRPVQAPLLTFRSSYTRWAKAFEQVPAADLEDNDKSVLRSLRDRLNAMDLE